MDDEKFNEMWDKHPHIWSLVSLTLLLVIGIGFICLLVWLVIALKWWGVVFDALIVSSPIWGFMLLDLTGTWHEEHKNPVYVGKKNEHYND